MRNCFKVLHNWVLIKAADNKSTIIVSRNLFILQNQIVFLRKSIEKQYKENLLNVFFDIKRKFRVFSENVFNIVDVYLKYHRIKLAGITYVFD
jgi:hypothetical protein